MAGYTAAAYDNPPRLFLTHKYDANGSALWNRTLGGDSYDEGHGVCLDAADAVYVAGHTQSFGAGGQDCWVVKYDADGILQWNKTIGTGEWEGCRAIVRDGQDDYVLAGYTANATTFEDYDVWVLKYWANWTQAWNRTFDGGGYEQGTDVAVDGDDNIYVAASQTPENVSEGAGDFILIKYSSAGVHQWNRSLGGSEWEESNAVAVASDGSIVVAGVTESFGAVFQGRDYWTVAYGADGILLWNRTFDAGSEVEDIAHGIATSDDGAIYVTGGAGPTPADVWTIAYNASGSLLWNRSDNDSSSASVGNDVVVADNGDLLVAGYADPPGAPDDQFVTVRYSQTTSTSTTSTSTSSTSTTSTSSTSTTSIPSTSTSSTSTSSSSTTTSTSEPTTTTTSTSTTLSTSTSTSTTSTSLTSTSSTSTTSTSTTSISTTSTTSTSTTSTSTSTTSTLCTQPDCRLLYGGWNLVSLALTP